MVLRHIDTGHHILIVEEVVRKGFRQLGLAHARGAEEDETADGSLGVLQARTTAADGVAHGFYGFVLPNHALVEFFLQV